MKIAIVGAGFAGLSVAWHLADLDPAYEITVFDKKSSKASMVSAGLCHPFPAKGAKLSFAGYKALHETILLLKEAQKFSEDEIADFSGVLKLASTNDAKIALSKLARVHPRTSWLKESKNHSFIKNQGALLIENGITVYSEKYLLALEKACSSKKVHFVEQTISSLDELKSFDTVILAVGASVKEFIKDDPYIRLVKGQVLSCGIKGKCLDKSLIIEGYIANTGKSGVYNIGSTYEHNFDSELPNKCVAKEKIFHSLKNSNINLKEDEIEILDVKAGVRVTNPKTHLPTIRKMSDRLYCITQLGSRGLLYHGMLGMQLSHAIHRNDTTRISREFFRT
ncbi:MAG: tRNA 5-methylaminomethyl-2-thiouridine biosynthesis bifunctional protein MnmC [Chlamydiia bacterium]|nr:tRNA 5-methylaminomethyl-2-thiouridine biosynthesis bifunctional protein MnmC [Chlamydiia bacterium]